MKTFRQFLSEGNPTYQEVYGVKVRKVVFQNMLKGKNYTPASHFSYLSQTQRDKLKDMESKGHTIINGFQTSGKLFNSPDSNEGTTFERAIAIVTKEGDKGAIAVLPSGKTKTLTSKSWKPEVDDFKQ